jgi:MscS family membrane protein
LPDTARIAKQNQTRRLAKSAAVVSNFHMNWRFQWIYRVGLAFLFVGVGWSVWAQTLATNAPAENAATVPATNFFDFRLPAHSLSFGLDQFPMLCDHTLLNQPLWKYLASLIFIALAFVVARALNYIVNHWLKRIAAKTPTKYDDLILELLRGPVELVAFVILVHIGLGIFDWPPRAQEFLSRALLIVVACSITYVALKLVDLFLGLWREKFVSPQDRVFANQLIPLISKTVKIVVVIAAVMLTAENLHWEIKSLLAGLSVGGLALGLAAQDTVANLFGAVAVFLDKPFYVGDRIKVDVVDGTVESIGLRSTRVRNLDG